jgi:hypothetical protein
VHDVDADQPPVVVVEDVAESANKAKLLLGCDSGTGFGSDVRRGGRNANVKPKRI